MNRLITILLLLPTSVLAEELCVYKGNFVGEGFYEETLEVNVSNMTALVSGAKKKLVKKPCKNRACLQLVKNTKTGCTVKDLLGTTVELEKFYSVDTDKHLRRLHGRWSYDQCQTNIYAIFKNGKSGNRFLVDGKPYLYEASYSLKNGYYYEVGTDSDGQKVEELSQYYVNQDNSRLIVKISQTLDDGKLIKADPSNKFYYDICE